MFFATTFGVLTLINSLSNIGTSTKDVFMVATKLLLNPLCDGFGFEMKNTDLRWGERVWCEHVSRV